MDETTNMKLKKPVENEYISIEIINENMDIIDTGMKEISDSVDAPVFDDSGSVVGITNKTTLLASFVSKMPLVKFLRNVKAGFKLVSFVGDIVNNCVTDNANLPLSAAQGKKLMDLYTVLNTNFKEMLTVNTYTYSQPIEIPANYGKKISIALTIPDDYVFLCVTNIKTNEEVAYSYFTGIEQNVLTCFVGNDREVPKIIPNGISVDVLLIKKWR